MAVVWPLHTSLAINIYYLPEVIRAVKPDCWFQPFDANCKHPSTLSQLNPGRTEPSLHLFAVIDNLMTKQRLAGRLDGKLNGQRPSGIFNPPPLLLALCLCFLLHFFFSRLRHSLSMNSASQLEGKTRWTLFNFLHPILARKGEQLTQEVPWKRFVLLLFATGFGCFKKKRVAVEKSTDFSPTSLHLCVLS